MGIFSFRAAGEVVFGAGAAEGIGPEIRKRGGKRILLVVDPGFARTGLLSRITDSLEKAGLSFTRFDEVEPEPPVELADRCADRGRQEGCDFVLGVGGGSAMDTAKAAAVLATNGGRARDYQGLDKVPQPGLPKAMIPTTAGTGSEVTFTAVFVNREIKKKAGINSAHLYPELAVLDPELTLNLPPQVTASTGMDALAHAIESYTSRAAGPVSAVFSREAIELIGKSLRRAVSNGADLEARSDLLLGSLLAGLGLANAGVTAVHSLSYPLGGMFGIAHGTANALLLPPVMRFNALSAPEKFARVARLLGEEVEGAPEGEAALKAVRAVGRLSREIGIPQRLRELGIPRAAIPELARGALEVSRPLENNPRPVSLEEAVGIYEETY